MRARPRFSPEQKNRLLSRLRLTAQQVDQLDRRLPEIADWLLPLPRGRDVRDQLVEMAAHLEKAEALLRRWHTASARGTADPSSMREALGHFNVTAAPLVRGGAGLDLHDDLDPSAIITMAAYIARRAVEASPGQQTRRTATRSSAQAIRIICEALERPKDEYSRTRAGQLRPSRSGDFLALAKVVWSAVLPGVSKASPMRSIQNYIAQQ